MAARLAVCTDAREPEALARFWGVLLEETVEAGADSSWLVPGDERRPALRFVPAERPTPGLDRVHWHLTSQDEEDQQRLVAAALDLGGRHLDVGQGAAPHVVLADPEGGEFCVIEPGNRFLAGTGRLGEVACDGSAAVGRFWSAALGWPLVWDHDGETAVQAPAGGTKISWGGSPVAPRTARSRHRFELMVGTGPEAAAGWDAEHDRLLALGARPDPAGLGPGDLLDPDGADFRLVPAAPGRAGSTAGVVP